jgi:CBS domain-containing protein
MQNDNFDEESDIANEQDSDTALSSASFKSPISEMSIPRVICVESDSSIGDSIKIMQKQKIGSVVVKSNEKIVGIVTERDILLKVIGLIKDYETRPISEIMTASPQSLMATDAIAYVLNNMHVGGYRHIPIVDANEKPIGIISIKDVVSWVLDYFPQEITNMTGEPYRGEVSREGA